MTPKLRTCIAYGCTAQFYSRDSCERVCPACRPHWEIVASKWASESSPPITWDPDADEIEIDGLELDDEDEIDRDLFDILDEYEADLGDYSPEREE